MLKYETDVGFQVRVKKLATLAFVFVSDPISTYESMSRPSSQMKGPSFSTLSQRELRWLLDIGSGGTWKCEQVLHSLIRCGTSHTNMLVDQRERPMHWRHFITALLRCWTDKILKSGSSSPAWKSSNSSRSNSQEEYVEIFDTHWFWKFHAEKYWKIPKLY